MIKQEIKIFRPYGDNEYLEQIAIIKALEAGWKVVSIWGGEMPKVVLKNPQK